MEKIHLYDKILSPVVTEKSTNLSELNKIVFKVPDGANKKNLKISKPIEFARQDPEHVFDGFRFDILLDLAEERSGDYFENGDHDDSDSHENGEYDGVIVDKWGNYFSSGQQYDYDTSLDWIGDWTVDEDNFIMVVYEQNQMFENFDDQKFRDYTEKIIDYFF